MAQPECNIGQAQWVFDLALIQMISKTECLQALDKAACHDIYQNKFIQNVGNDRCGYWLILICLNGRRCYIWNLNHFGYKLISISTAVCLFCAFDIYLKQIKTKSTFKS
jgi:hypothetical protein